MVLGINMRETPDRVKTYIASIVDVSTPARREAKWRRCSLCQPRRRRCSWIVTDRCWEAARVS